MARFADDMKSMNEAIDLAVDVANQNQQRVDTAHTDGSATLEVDEVINGIVRQSGQSSSMNLTTPDAADIVAAIPNCQVGSSFEFIVINENDAGGDVTVVGGTDVTIVGADAVAEDKTQIFRGRVTDADEGSEAVDLIALFVAAV